MPTSSPSFTPADTAIHQTSWDWCDGVGKQPTYRIQVSWPLTWPGREIHTTADAIFLVDGNALFLTATETLRRCQSDRTIVVAVGYPLMHSVFSPRRALDLTPPCDGYTPHDTPDGRPGDEPYGGADAFLSFIIDIVQPFLRTSVFPNVSVSRTALFGHSYGGLFTLHALFTRPQSFNTFLVASPSIWWNNRFIFTEAQRFCQEAVSQSGTPPTVHISFGSQEQFPLRRRGESEEAFERRAQIASCRRMTGNCKEMYTLLVQSGLLAAVEMREYPDENHGSVIAPALSGAIFYFLDSNVD